MQTSGVGTLKKFIFNIYFSQISDETLEKIKAGNHLDPKLYEFAQSLFFQRYEDYKKSR